MKNNLCLIDLKQLLVVTTIVIGLSACSSDSETPNMPDNAKLSMAVIKTSGTGDGTSAQPFIATPDKPLNVTLAQTVTYNDANGQQSVSPKATLAATVKTDTIRATNLVALTKLAEQAPIIGTQGSNPKTNTCQQTFDIGGQEITFNLSHEIFSYTNSSGQQMELPYVALKAPKYGSATPDQIYSTRSAQGFGSMPVVSVTAIRLTPAMVSTRGITVRDTTMYNATVSFTIEAETRNTDANTTQALSADIHYTALVEDITELPDPTTSISYELTARSGTDSTKSPFACMAKEPLQLEWTAQSKCTYFSKEDLGNHVVSLQPKASVTINVLSDTVRWNRNLDSLTVVSSTEPTVITSGQLPQHSACMQSINIGGQTITVNWSYEDYGSIQVGDSTVVMPYLMLDTPEVVEVKMQETSQAQQTRNRISGRTYTVSEGQTRAEKSSDISNFESNIAYYEVTVTLRQSLKGKNTPNDVSETVEYVVKYIAAVEVKLISTTYERDYEWAEPKYNLHWRYTFIIKRIRTYSTGEQETDTFWAPTCWVVGLSGLFSVSDAVGCVYHRINSDAQNDDFRCIRTTRTGVPNINNVSWENFEDVDTWNERNLRDYKIVHYTTHFDPENPIENWYHGSVKRFKRIAINYAISEYANVSVMHEGPVITYSDVFLYLDGQVIDFSDYRMTYDFDFSEENTALSDGSPAKVFTHECKAKYLGKDFYVALVDTVYQLK